MAAAVASTPTPDLRQPGNYPLRLGTSILKPRETKHWTSLRYNHRPTEPNGQVFKSRVRPKRHGKSSVLELKAGDEEYTFEGNSVEEEDSYVLICNGEGASPAWVLEKLSSTYCFNLVGTLENNNAATLAEQYPHISVDDDSKTGDALLGASIEGEDGEAEPSNPFDFRHFMKEEVLRSQEAPRSTVGTPSLAPVQAASSTPVVRPAKKANAFAPPQPKKRKAPATDKAVTKRPKSTKSIKDNEEPEKASKPPRSDTPHIRVDRKASLRQGSIDDSGELILENEPASSSNLHPSAMSLALNGQLGNGPISLRSAASSPASRVASPAPEEQNIYAFELGGSESPEQEAPMSAGAHGRRADLAGELDEEEEDADVEDLELPSPAQVQRPRPSIAQSRGGGDGAGAEDDEDDLEKQLELAMAGGGEEEEESEEE